VRQFVVGIAASVVASALIYLVLAATEAAPLPVRLAVMALVLVLGIAVAWVVSRDIQDSDGEGTTVGSHINAANDITVEHLDVKGSGGGVRVGTNLKSRGKVRVSDVRVGRGEDSE
jgi:hypothetical protein